MHCFSFHRLNGWEGRGKEGEGRGGEWGEGQSTSQMNKQQNLHESRPTYRTSLYCLNACKQNITLWHLPWCPASNANWTVGSGRT